MTTKKKSKGLGCKETQDVPNFVALAVVWSFYNGIPEEKDEKILQRKTTPLLTLAAGAYREVV